MQDESFLKGQSKIQVEDVVVGHQVQTDTETVITELELPVEDFRERIKHFKTDLMLLKQKVWTVRDIALQENRKIEELIGVCAESKTKLSTIEE